MGGKGRTVFFCLGEGINLLFPTIKEVIANKRNSKIQESKKEEGNLIDLLFKHNFYVFPYLGSA